MLVDTGKYEEAVRLYRESDLKRVDVCRLLGLDYHAFTYFIQSRFPELIKKQKSNVTTFARETKKATEKKYRQALVLCENTDYTYKEIAEKTGVSPAGLRNYVAKYHRDILLRRRGMDVSKREANLLKVRRREMGMTIDGYERYKDAIEACDSLEFIELNVTEIAEKFEVSPAGLLAQLRVHFPEISQRRERVRRSCGYADTRRRGARYKTKAQYEEAINLLRNTEMTIEEAAQNADVSSGGLRNHLLAYHKDVVAKRRERIDAPTEKPIKSALRIAAPKEGYEEMAAKYAPAVAMLNEGAESVEKVAKDLGLVPESLRNYLKNYMPELFAKFGKVKTDTGRVVLARSANKYSEAIEELRNSSLSLKGIAEKYGLVYKSFSSFIRRNYPELLRK